MKGANTPLNNYERAAVVFLSYMIGFITAFIAFGIDNAGSGTTKEYDSVAEDRMNYVPVASAESNAIGIVSRNDGLFALNGEAEKIIAAKFEGEGDIPPGYYTELVTAAVSADGHYVHYCVQVNPEDSDCLNFLYDVEADTVYRVRVGETQLASALGEARPAVWNDNGQMTIDGAVSIDASEPWNLSR